MSVPRVSEFDRIYSEDEIPQQKSRWDSLLNDFKGRYGGQAEFVSRSPGRVNIIGEVRSRTLRKIVFVS